MDAQFLDNFFTCCFMNFRLEPTPKKIFDIQFSNSGKKLGSQPCVFVFWPEKGHFILNTGFLHYCTCYEAKNKIVEECNGLFA